jgi:hypothetical protein
MSGITAILFKLGLFGTLSNEYPAPRFLNMLKDNKFLEQGLATGDGFRQQIVGFYLYHPFVWRRG